MNAEGSTALIETDSVFRSRVTTILESDGVPALTSARPWTLHEGRGYEKKSGDELVTAFRGTRARTIALVEGDVGHLAQTRR